MNVKRSPPNLGLQLAGAVRSAGPSPLSLGTLGTRRKSVLKPTLFIMAALALRSSQLGACSRITLHPIVVSPEIVAFSGVVVGYPTARGTLLGATDVVGLRVTVVEALLSSKPGATFQIYLFGILPDCSPVPRSGDDLHQQYPLGSTVTVVAGRGSASSASNASPLTLVTEADDWGHVGRVLGSEPLTPEGFLDFRAFRREYEEHPKGGFSPQIAWRNSHRKWLEDFEYLRCLVALRRLTTPAAKVAMLENLASYSRWGQMGSQWERDQYHILVDSVRLPAALAESLLREIEPRREEESVRAQTITVTNDGVSINGKTVSLPASEASVLEILSEPFYTYPPRGDEYSNWVFRWPDLGIEAYSDPRTRLIHAVLITRPGNWHGRLFHEAVALYGEDLCLAEPERLEALGFVNDGNVTWKWRAGCLYVRISTADELIHAVEIGTHSEDFSLLPFLAAKNPNADPCEERRGD